MITQTKVTPARVEQIEELLPLADRDAEILLRYLAYHADEHAARSVMARETVRRLAALRQRRHFTLEEEYEWATAHRTLETATEVETLYKGALDAVAEGALL